MGFPAGYTHVFIHLDFETYVHLNFEVPVAVTIIRKDGSPPVYGVVTGVIPDPAAVPPVSHPAIFAGP